MVRTYANTSQTHKYVLNHITVYGYTYIKGSIKQ